jgi:hypothetical protein
MVLLVALHLLALIPTLMVVDLVEVEMALKLLVGLEVVRVALEI